MIKLLELLNAKYVQFYSGNPHSLKDGWEEFVGIVRLKVYWASFLAIGLVIAWTGSFDSDYIDSLPIRYVSIVGFLLFSGFACAAIAGLCRGLAGVSSLRQFDTVIKIAVFWVLVATVPARFMINYLGDIPVTTTNITRSAVHGASIAFLVIVVMYLFGQRKYLLKKRLAQRDEPTTTSQTTTSQTTTSQTTTSQTTTSQTTTSQTAEPPVFEAPIKRPMPLPYYIESEDHYLKMVYLGRIEFIRANLSEVAAKFASRGFRCHKSYWVSRTAIDGRKRQGRQLLLILKDGTEIPVGRSFEKEVRAVVDAELAYG